MSQWQSRNAITCAENLLLPFDWQQYPINVTMTFTSYFDSSCRRGLQNKLNLSNFIFKAGIFVLAALNFECNESKIAFQTITLIVNLKKSMCRTLLAIVNINYEYFAQQFTKICTCYCLETKNLVTYVSNFN